MSAESTNDIAIIGMSGRFPGAHDLTEFWKLLCEGREGTTTYSADELAAAGISRELLDNPNYVRVHGAITGVELFDASFFGFSPREAEITDPQHRIFLEHAWAALESAGYCPDNYEDAIGVYAGASGGAATYLLNNLLPDQALRDSVGDFQLFIANEKDTLATRVAYKLNLRGPAITIQTACSTSLVAVVQACQSLLTYQCDMALAGGVSVSVPYKAGYLHQEGMIMSPDGKCRAFDSRSAGTVGGNGVGLVVLKRLQDAINDGDNICAVIKGLAINNDGSQKVGYTAPSLLGQAAVITQALAMADADPESISYVEAHGTATPIGDPIEVKALTQAFRNGTQKKEFCSIGSLKTNIGHTDAAAGVAGLLKTVLMLQHKMLPPSLHFSEPNPRLELESSPFYVQTKLAEWKTQGGPRRAGVSSFGIGGTNAHVVLEEAPVLHRDDRAGSYQLLVLSGRTTTTLDCASANLVEHLRQHPELNLTDVAYTLQVGRRGFEHRRAVVCADRLDAIAALDTVALGRSTTAQAASDRRVAFMFPGQGSQYIEMGRGLYYSQASYREHVDRCCELLRAKLDFDLRTVLFPADSVRERARAQLAQIAITLPALFVVEYALAKMWADFGVEPTAMIGYSMGEYVAACLAGVMSLEDALMLIAERGRLMGRMAPGSMLAVPLSEERVLAMLSPGLSIAAMNSAEHCVVSGPDPLIQELEERLTQLQLGGRRLETSHAFHSAMMEPLLGSFVNAVRRVKLSAPRIPYISNLTGHWITKEQATDPEYYGRQLRETVRFGSGIDLILQDPGFALLEVGPSAVLAKMAKHHLRATTTCTVVASLPSAKKEITDRAATLDALGRLWASGIAVKWQALYPNEHRRRVPLPTYPFERARFWHEAPQAPGTPRSQPLSSSPAAPAADPTSDYLYEPVWIPAIVKPAPAEHTTHCWVLLVNSQPLCNRIVDRLRLRGDVVTIVHAGRSFASVGSDEYIVSPCNRDDYERLFEDLQRRGRSPSRTVHLWNVGEAEGSKALATLEAVQDLAFFSLTTLAQAIGRIIPTAPLSLTVCTTGAVRLNQQETLKCPERALVTGPCKVIPAEYTNVTCQHADVSWAGTSDAELGALADSLVNEWSTTPLETTVAYRGCKRYCLEYRPIGPPSSEGKEPRLRSGGTYLITGGLGGIGMTIAEFLARQYGAKLVLTTRGHGIQSGNDPIEGETTPAVNRLQQLGSQVMVLRADVSDMAAMQQAVAAAVARFGRIHGVIHSAGVPGGGVLQRRSRADSEGVFAPKVRGTLILDEIFANTELDFFLLCSSMNAVLGGFGLADYCSANAFLDAFAQSRATRSAGLTVSVNWHRWLEVGMAVNSARERQEKPAVVGAPSVVGSQVGATSFSVAEGREKALLDEQKYICMMDAEHTWIVNEHRIHGVPTLPGTAYLKLACDAYRQHRGKVAAVELQQVAFLVPLKVPAATRCAIQVILRPIGEGDNCEFSIQSRPEGEQAQWKEHALGRIRALPSATDEHRDISALLQALPLKPLENLARSTRRPLAFGPRWNNIEAVGFSDDCGLAAIRHPDAFLQDLESEVLHPALLDSATSFIAGRHGGHYLPFSYERVRVLRPLVSRMYSYITFEDIRDGERGRIKVNATVMDHTGAVLVEAHNYVSLRVSE